MQFSDIDDLLEAVRDGSVSPEQASDRLRSLPFADLGFARVDHHRRLRQGMPEAVFAPHKTPEQCAAIISELVRHGSGPVILTRATRHQRDVALRELPGGLVTPESDDPEGVYFVSWKQAPRKEGQVVVVTAGTSDLPVAHECVATLRAYGFSPELLVDCGVAGIHRLLVHERDLRKCDAIVVVAGMEGALASVVGGLVAAPVVAVPTSVGYGSSLEGVTALLAMLSSCAPGVVVVGIDNGYGAACAITRLLR
ncbi:MAG: nickel pincer cofactor biosynthesis protein LarB [Acidimicrobiales bacterium]